MAENIWIGIIGEEDARALELLNIFSGKLGFVSDGLDEEARLFSGTMEFEPCDMPVLHFDSTFDGTPFIFIHKNDGI